MPQLLNGPLLLVLVSGRGRESLLCCSWDVQMQTPLSFLFSPNYHLFPSYLRTIHTCFFLMSFKLYSIHPSEHPEEIIEIVSLNSSIFCHFFSLSPSFPYDFHIRSRQPGTSHRIRIRDMTPTLPQKRLSACGLQHGFDRLWPFFFNDFVPLGRR